MHRCSGIMGVLPALLLLALPLQSRSFAPSARLPTPIGGVPPCIGTGPPTSAGAVWHAPWHPPERRGSHRVPRYGSRSSCIVWASSNTDATERSKGTVLVLGGTGFVGRHVVDLLDNKGIAYLATSTHGRDGTIALDLTGTDAPQQLLHICQANDVSTIVSTVGSIFADGDYEVNSASGRTAAAAFGELGDGYELPKYVFIGNSPRVRNVCNAIKSLNEYSRGKEESERLIEQTFAEKAFVMKPTFIYGGDDFGLNPPRLPSGIGEILEALLGLYPIQATSEALPDILGVALEAPVNVESVAGAIANAATGLCDDPRMVETREEIIMAASQRPTVSTMGQSATSNSRRRDELKTILSTNASEYSPEENFAMLEELERLRPASTRPTEDPTLNGRWDFCFDVEPDVGTGFIKDLFEGDGPAWLRKIINFNGVHMEIGDGQTTIQLVVSLDLFEKETKLVLHTSLSPARRNQDGVMFMERFEGVELNGLRLPYPNAWKKSRYLEFSYLDEGFAIARGAGGEPHFLLRGS